MSDYITLSPALLEQIKTEHPDLLADDAIRRRSGKDSASPQRPAYVRDVEKILHSPYYNRYTDKTQVFSFYKDDDISRRALHVQLVSRIARNIGRVLGLNLDLIEAIALGHDIGHTPFGHAGERYLNEMYHAHTGRYFMHNVHSVRVLDGIFHMNISLQTLDGILCHNGELELDEYRPRPIGDFEAFDCLVEECYRSQETVTSLIPGTLEGCVVRISDIIAYLGKDRQDALRTGVLEDDIVFKNDKIGRFNAVMINNLVVNIIENSYGKPYIKMDPDFFDALSQGKRENYKLIYGQDALFVQQEEQIKPMFVRLYEYFLKDLKDGNPDSFIIKKHIDFIRERGKYYGTAHYGEEDPNQIVVDYLASMTDQYMIDLYEYLFPNAPKVEYVSYFR
ncbi:MAG: HD domain-containing protein [Clostridia bacterium]|nr:HD domain-containing protein [Clostridia bacterium]